MKSRALKETKNHRASSYNKPSVSGIILTYLKGRLALYVKHGATSTEITTYPKGANTFCIDVKKDDS
jgi:hypothetical protein